MINTPRLLRGCWRIRLRRLKSFEVLSATLATLAILLVHLSKNGFVNDFRRFEIFRFLEPAFLPLNTLETDDVILSHEGHFVNETFFNFSIHIKGNVVRFDDSTTMSIVRRALHVDFFYISTA